VRQAGSIQSEALDDLKQPLLVTGRDIDREVREIARVIGYALNLALHPHLSISDIELCLD
jgi:spore protease